jgi:hypothetical protein
VFGLENAVHLQELDLSGNRLHDLDGLSGCVNVRVLDVSDNELDRVDGLEGMTGLEVLLCGRNRLERQEDLRSLSLNTALRHLTLEGNPVARTVRFKVMVTSLLPGLSTLDGVRCHPAPAQMLQRREVAVAEKEGPHRTPGRASPSPVRPRGDPDSSDVFERLYASPLKQTVRLSELVAPGGARGRRASMGSPGQPTSGSGKKRRSVAGSTTALTAVSSSLSSSVAYPLRKRVLSPPAAFGSSAPARSNTSPEKRRAGGAAVTPSASMSASSEDGSEKARALEDARSALSSLAGRRPLTAQLRNQSPPRHQPPVRPASPPPASRAHGGLVGTPSGSSIVSGELSLVSGSLVTPNGPPPRVGAGAGALDDDIYDISAVYPLDEMDSVVRSGREAGGMMMGTLRFPTASTELRELERLARAKMTPIRDDRSGAAAPAESESQRLAAQIRALSAKVEELERRSASPAFIENSGNALSPPVGGPTPAAAPGSAVNVVVARRVLDLEPAAATSSVDLRPLQPALPPPKTPLPHHRHQHGEVPDVGRSRVPLTTTTTTTITNATTIGDEAVDDEAVPGRLEHLLPVVLSRDTIEGWLSHGFFEALVKGCFVRLGVGTTPAGKPHYHLAQIVGVENDPKPYRVMRRETRKTLLVRLGGESLRAFRISYVSNSPPLAAEFAEWHRGAASRGVLLEDLLKKARLIAPVRAGVVTLRDIEEIERHAALNMTLDDATAVADPAAGSTTWVTAETDIVEQAPRRIVFAAGPGSGAGRARTRSPSPAAAAPSSASPPRRSPFHRTSRSKSPGIPELRRPPPAPEPEAGAAMPDAAMPAVPTTIPLQPQPQRQRQNPSPPPQQYSYARARSPSPVADSTFSSRPQPAPEPAPEQKGGGKEKEKTREEMVKEAFWAKLKQERKKLGLE